MPRALAPAIRQAIQNRIQEHQSIAEIARAMDLLDRTVRRIVRQLQQRGETALQSRYAACGVSRKLEFVEWREKFLALRQQHPLWGAQRMLVELKRSVPVASSLPCERTLQRWLHEAYPTPAPAGRPRREVLQRATQPHQVWQVDASEQKRLGNNQMFSWLRAADECSGAVLKTVVFSRRIFSTSSPAARATGISQDL